MEIGRYMKIFVMGLTACGKTRQAKNIAEHFGMAYISGSQVLLSELKFEDNSTDHFWLESVGKNLNMVRDLTELDRYVDNLLLSKAVNENNLVFDSWTIPWLYSGLDAIRIYLKPSLDFRATLAYNSKTNKSLLKDDLKELITIKDEESRTRFLKLYGFDIYDTSIFDIVFDNTLLEKQQTSEMLIQRITEILIGQDDSHPL
jgi:cytidylate kinase